MIIDDEEYLAHYGVLRRSGRYPWGSGQNAPEHNRNLLDHISEMRRKGLSDTEIAKGLGMSTTDFRAERSRAKNETKQADIARAESLKAKGVGNTAAAKQMGIPESTYRSFLAPGAKDRADINTTTSDLLRRHVDEKKMIDVGEGQELYLGVSKERLNTAISSLKAEGYEDHTIPVRQLGTGKDTRVRVLATPGTTWGDVKRNQDKIQQIQEFSEDGGRSYVKIQPPLPISPKRIDIKYAEDGGKEADGVIYVRPGVKDLDMGKTPYAQVRIQVGPNHYVKGMAIYKDDLPPGADLVFHTSKKNTGNKLDAMKTLADDPQLPFGSIVRQMTKDGKVTSAINLVGHKETSGIEGGWDEWSKTLSSQMLSKQSPTLVKEQLNLTLDRRKKEFDEIQSLTNPTVKKKLLDEFADSADSSAVQLKAAHMPRQATRVILPINSLKENEVYAPGFRDGERVVLIRYPHGGTFEIPELVVNTKHAPAKKLIGDARDAVGIHSKVADQLSGADFDGDTVIVIPNNRGKIKTSSPLEQLKNFDPKSEYPKYDGMKLMDSHTKGLEMGKVSNLITDMTIRGAPHSDIARAIKHSMVVIDAEKHELNWKLSEERNGIKALVSQYQAPYKASGRGGASTLISRARSPQRVPELKPRPMKDGGPIDKATGQRILVPSGKTTINKSGEVVPKTKEYPLLSITEDAHALSSGTPVEKIYAEHSNALKSLANQARLTSLQTPRLKSSDSAKKTYAPEVNSLSSKLALAKKNAPRERQAQIIANAEKRARLAANPNLEKETIKKVEQQALTDARIRVGAKKQQIVINENEWNAIQAGAISDHKLGEILKHADMDAVRKFATPKAQRVMTSARTTKAKQMLDGGFTRAEVADRFGISVSTLDASIKELG